MVEPLIIKPKNIRNRFYLLVGAVILMVNKVRHQIQGYTRPRAFDVSEIDTAVKYDLAVVNKFSKVLSARSENWQGKTVLELGPGADLGVGLTLLAKGASKYFAVDVNKLATKAPHELYDHLFMALQDKGDLSLSKDEFYNQLDKALQGGPDRLNYLINKDFSLTAVKNKGVDLVISHHAFEHFENLSTLFADLSQVVVPGGLFIAEVDLQTHTRWIREADPLNIYRYGQGFYNAYKFLGSPNRVRPAEYIELLEKSGWQNVEIVPVIKLNGEYVKKVANTMAPEFSTSKDLDILSFILIAQKSGLIT